MPSDQEFFDAIKNVSVSADTINLNTDTLEAKVQAVSDKIPSNLTVSSNRLQVDALTPTLFTDGTNLTKTVNAPITAFQVIIPQTDVASYREASISITANTLGTITGGNNGSGLLPQISNDGTNWYVCGASTSDGTFTLSGFTGAASSVTYNGNLYKISLNNARYFRVVFAGTVSTGSISLVCYLSQTPTTTLGQSGLNNIGRVYIEPTSSYGYGSFNTLLSGATAVAQSLRGTTANLTTMIISNTTASARYVKVFNKLSGSVTIGTTSPDFQFLAPANQTISFDFGVAGARFSNGISVFVSTGSALLDATAGSAGDVLISTVST